MWTMGTYFKYQYAHTWFRQMDKLIHYVNICPLFNISYCPPSEINLAHGKYLVVKSSNVYPKDSEALPCGVDNITKLAYLHEPGVLSNLKSRYDINEIYISSASFLVPWSFI